LSSGLWIFGYGSLIWRPGFSYRERRLAHAVGWRRVLAQGSPDHRGTPERLGRVVTLVPAEGALCGGVVYAIEESSREAILAALDEREQGGYERVAIDVVLDHPPRETVRAVTWIAAPENPYHLGEAPFDQLIGEIRASVGPSGTNIEYVLRLAEALRELGIDDGAILDIAAALALASDSKAS
jgi:glutathione-specific gamma-glutamylcyclotransferase